MGIDKSEISKAALTRVDIHIDEEIADVEKQVAEAQGAATALKEQAKNLQSIVAATEISMEQPGSSDHIPDLETLKLVRMWLTKCVRAVENAAVSRKNHGLVASGSLAQLQATRGWVQQQVKMEDVRIGLAQNAKALVNQVVESTGKLPEGVIPDEDGDLMWVGDGTSPPGIRPGNRIERRAYAEAKEMLAKDAVASSGNGKTDKKAPRKKSSRKKAAKKKTAKQATSKSAPGVVDG